MTLEYAPVSVHRAAWSDDSTVICKLREHGADNNDASAFHYLASLGGEQHGYLRLNHSGEIDRVVSHPAYREEIVAALLRFAILDAPARGLPRLHAPATSPHGQILLQTGFRTDENAPQQLELLLPPDRQSYDSGSVLVRLDTTDSFRAFSLQLLQQAKRSVQIYSEDLEAWLYDNDAFTSAVMAFVQRARMAQVRIIVRDTRAIIENDHRLLRASQRAGEKIQIRTLTSRDNKQPAYLLTDDNGLLYRADSETIVGSGYCDYRARVKPLLEQFDEMWARAWVDPALRRLSL